MLSKPKHPQCGQGETRTHDLLCIRQVLLQPTELPDHCVGVEEFESSPTEPESVMLPLHHTPIDKTQGTSAIFVLRAPKLLPTLDEQFVGVTGLEPATLWSQTRCATNCATPRLNLLRVEESDLCQYLMMDFALFCCKYSSTEDMLLFNCPTTRRTRNVFVDHRGLEPLLKACKAPVLPLSLTAHKVEIFEVRISESNRPWSVKPLHYRHAQSNFNLVEDTRLELVTFGMQIRRSTK